MSSNQTPKPAPGTERFLLSGSAETVQRATLPDGSEVHLVRRRTKIGTRWQVRRVTGETFSVVWDVDSESAARTVANKVWTEARDTRRV